MLSLLRQLGVCEVRSITIMRTKTIYKATEVYSFCCSSAQVITHRSQLAVSAPAQVQLSRLRAGWALFLA
nr:MAG TPA: hypothetical protein [Caudoviricetes sp.]